MRIKYFIEGFVYFTVGSFLIVSAYVLIVLVIPLFVGRFYPMEQHFSSNPYIDTTFSKNFSFDGFEKIQVGMTEEQVVKILGEPLEKIDYEKVPSRLVWEYSTDGGAPYPLDFSWYQYSIVMQNGKVKLKEVDEFFD